MAIHSNILVHWTGKDIEATCTTSESQQYVERLADICQNGLFVKRTVEAVVRGMKIKRLLRLCFTEIRLSQAQRHAERYGKLGIGFAREFIMKKGGRPVIYIPHAAEADGRLLEDSIRNIYEHSKDNEDIRRWAKWILAHVKRMSDGPGDTFFEELEWRLVYDERESNPHFTKVLGKEFTECHLTPVT